MKIIDFITVFSVVYGALLTKTNRIARIFDASKRSAKRPEFISPKSQLIICSGLIFVQVLINVIWMLVSPPEAIHHYPSREDNLLVCKVFNFKFLSRKEKYFLYICFKMMCQIFCRKLLTGLCKILYAPDNTFPLSLTVWNESTIVHSRV